MQKRSQFTPLFCLTLLLVLAALMMAGCGSTTQPSAYTHTTKGRLIPTATRTGTLAPGTPVTLTSPPTPTPMPTPTPVPLINVSWTTPATMYTLGSANVRSAPSTGANIVATEAAATAVTVFGSAEGDMVNGNATWDRITDQNSDPQYILSALLGVNKPAPPPPPTPVQASVPPGVPPAPISTGQVIFVNLTTQHLYAYLNGALVNDFLITSGRPELQTPTGTFTVLDKATNVTFYSPWPVGSPYYYSPEFVPYALRLTNTGIYIHAAPWREAGDFGPGTQYPHALPDGTQSTGSHGCINTTTGDAGWTYNWAPIGTPVVISY